MILRVLKRSSQSHRQHSCRLGAEASRKNAPRVKHKITSERPIATPITPLAMSVSVGIHDICLSQVPESPRARAQHSHSGLDIKPTMTLRGVHLLQNL